MPTHKLLEGLMGLIALNFDQLTKISILQTEEVSQEMTLYLNMAFFFLPGM